MHESRVHVHKSTVTSREGMVTALHPVAARAGVQIMQAGGNAVDALLTTLAVMSVVEPFMSGLGGHGAAVVAMNGQEPVVIDGSATAPAAFTVGGAELRGPRSVPTPNAARAWEELHARWATRDLPDLLSPAIQLARSGTPVEWYTAMMIAGHMELLHANAAARAAFLLDGWRPPAPAFMHEHPADRLPSTDIAETLARFAKNGAAEIITGQTGAQLVAAVESLGGWLREDDLVLAPAAEPYAALNGSFRGFDIHAGPRTSAAGYVIHMLESLAELDPELVPLGSPEYYEQLILAQASGRSVHEQLGDVGSSTTHVNVVDAGGNMASATFTLGHPFGSGIVAPGTGLLLLNTLLQFSSQKGHPNAPAPGKRAVWNGSPLILSRHGQPLLSIGAPGGPRIPAAIVQVLLNHVVYGLSPQAAVQVPRVFLDRDRVLLDDRVDALTVDALRRRGHVLELVRESYSSVNFARPGLISLDLSTGNWIGGIDEWRIGAVVGI